MSLLAHDPHDQALEKLVHPPHWPTQPAINGYDFIAIGGGTAGLVSTGGAAMLGAQTALIERQRLGGDCLVTGCVPSKALLHAANLAHTLRHAADYGIHPGAVEIDFPTVMNNLRQSRAQIAHDDSAQTVSDRGIDVLFGNAAFSSPRTLSLNGQTIPFKRAIICTGSRPRIPEIPGLTPANTLTSDTVFNLTQRPQRLAIIGAGPIGCELGQAFARLGSTVTLIARGPRILPREDPQASKILQQALKADGLHLSLSTEIDSVSEDGKTLRGSQDGIPWHLQTDQILVATGRVPNTENLSLEAAHIESTPNGIAIDHYQRTTNPRVYAAGDVANAEKFTHAAYAYAEYATLNALAPIQLFDARKRQIPRCTYTSPEIAHIGLPYEELAAGTFDCYHEPLSRNDRAKIHRDPPGFAKLYAPKGKNQIVAATLVAPNAGDLIATLSLSMTPKRGLDQLARTVIPYPTRSEILRRAADQYSFKAVTPTVRKLAQAWFRLMR